MNITLTDEQFNQIKDEIKNEIINQYADYLVNNAKKFSPSDYEFGEIRNKIKINLAEDLKSRVLKNINISKIEKDIERSVNQRVQAVISKVVNKSINVQISATLVKD